MVNVARLLGGNRASEVPGPVTVLQRAMSQRDMTSMCALVDALDATVQQRLWADRRCTRGSPFNSFSEFVVALSPAGLGVRSNKPLKLLRQLLLDAGYYAEWVELLERTMRVRGRPRTNLANGEDFPRFYQVPTSLTCQDRMLLCLKHNYTDTFTALCEAKGSIRQAAIKAGVIAA
jgi:hypothetical protein